MSMKREEVIPMASAYAIVPTQEELERHQDTTTTWGEESATLAVPVADEDSSNVELNRPAAFEVSPQFQSIPETLGLTWRDDFFDDEDNIVAVFDFDYDHMEQHYRTLGWACFVGTALCFPGCIFWCLLGLVPCHINKNVHWSVRAQHVAVTRQGLLFVHDRRPACWGEQCAVAKRTQMIPFDEIKDCTVTDSGSGALSKVSINHRASQNFTIVGLVNPHGFQKLVMALKRHDTVIPSNSAAAVLPVTMAERIDRGLASAQNNTNGDENVAGILREIRDELRQHNQLLQAIKPQQK